MDWRNELSKKFNKIVLSDDDGIGLENSFIPDFSNGNKKGLVIVNLYYDGGEKLALINLTEKKLEILCHPKKDLTKERCIELSNYLKKRDYELELNGFLD